MRFRMCIIPIVLTLLLFIPVTGAPEANPYDLYNIDTYNCLDIAIDCQRWHERNGINTTIVIGMFNETYGHAWLIDTDTGKDIVGYVLKWEYMRIIYGLENYERIVCIHQGLSEQGIKKIIIQSYKTKLYI